MVRGKRCSWWEGLREREDATRVVIGYTKDLDFTEVYEAHFGGQARDMCQAHISFGCDGAVIGEVAEQKLLGLGE